MNVPDPHAELSKLFDAVDLDPAVLKLTELTGQDPVFPSAFAVGTAAQVSMAAAAAMAAHLGQLRGLPEQSVRINMRDAAIECTGYFTLDGKESPKFAELSGLYPCKDGWLRLHANFDHHRDAALQTLGITSAEGITRSTVESKTINWLKQTLEDSILNNAGACAAVRTFDEWDAMPQATAIAELPLVSITKIADAPCRVPSPLQASAQMLSGIRILDLTRILAGPVCGRTLAAYGADVMLINSPALPNIDSIVETSRGKLSAHIDLHQSADKSALLNLVKESDVYMQGYRPGALAAHGLTAESLAEINPGIICTSLSAYSHCGPWRDRRGYDSLVQSACGFNLAEADASGAALPQALPMQILDYASGFLMAFGTQAALHKQWTEGGSWHVQVSLARTGLWLRSMGQNKDWLHCRTPDSSEALQSYDCGYGKLQALPHAPLFSHSKTGWNRPSVAPGTHRPQWPDAIN